VSEPTGQPTVLIFFMSLLSPFKQLVPGTKPWQPLNFQLIIHNHLPIQHFKTSAVEKALLNNQREVIHHLFDFEPKNNESESYIT
jgi:hypothetical protein